MKAWKYSGIFLVATGILHTLLALFLGWAVFVDMFRDGLVDSVGDDVFRNRALWFLVCGVILIFWGHSLHFYIRRSQAPVPLSIGWGLLIFSAVGCVILPLSGFWLFLPQAVIIIAAHKKKTRK